MKSGQAVRGLILTLFQVDGLGNLDQLSTVFDFVNQFRINIINLLNCAGAYRNIFCYIF